MRHTRVAVHYRGNLFCTRDRRSSHYNPSGQRRRRHALHIEESLCEVLFRFLINVSKCLPSNILGQNSLTSDLSVYGDIKDGVIVYRVVSRSEHSKVGDRYERVHCQKRSTGF